MLFFSTGFGNVWIPPLHSDASHAQWTSPCCYPYSMKYTYTMIGGGATRGRFSAVFMVVSATQTFERSKKQIGYVAINQSSPTVEDGIQNMNPRIVEKISHTTRAEGEGRGGGISGLYHVQGGTCDGGISLHRASAPSDRRAPHLVRIPTDSCLHASKSVTTIAQGVV